MLGRPHLNIKNNETYVMDDMEMSNIVEEETALPSKEVTVDGSSSTALEVPLLAAVMGQSRVRVVKVSDHDDCLINEMFVSEIIRCR